MKQLVLLSFAFILFSCDEQNKQSQPGLQTSQFVDYYNNKKYDSIFYLFSTDMRAALPLETTVAFFSQLQVDAGKIKKLELIETEGLFTQYKTNFEKGLFLLKISLTAKEINGLQVTPYDEPDTIPVMPRNATKMTLPFSDEWFVFWGGDTKQQNYHVAYRAQKNAFDILITDTKGKSFKTDGKTNEDYYAFGQPLNSPCDAEIVMVTDSIADNVPGVMNARQVTGNTVVLKTANNEYILFAHFKINSIKVKKGEIVKRGQLLGFCGNSGNSSEPHLHFHIQNKENMNGATGIKCYFDKLLVNGDERNDYSPVKGDKIKNSN
jgi:hypothetical protein